MFVCVPQLICGTAVLLLHINNDFFAISASASVYLSVSLSISSFVCPSVSLQSAISLSGLVGWRTCGSSRKSICNCQSVLTRNVE